MAVIPSERVSLSLAALAVGTVSAVSELVGTLLAPPFLGLIADKFGLNIMMILAAACLIPLFLVMFFMKETAPRILSLKNSVKAQM
nr:hypothetical protein [Sporomusa silvacetica]